jgi:precorrin-3B methylase
MFTTVFVGNSQTKVIETAQGKKLVTPRGYDFER